MLMKNVTTAINASLLLLVLSLSMHCTKAPQTSLISSYWKYSDDDVQYEVYFKPNGHVYSYHPNDHTPENDYWKQRGKKISFHMNDGYAHYKGKLLNDSTMLGIGKSKGFRWSWTAKMISKD
jgi:hypothetical protein